jgi:hypothetical protein
MNDASNRDDKPRGLSPGEAGWWTRDPLYMAWMADHISDLRKSEAEDRILNWTLALGFVVGLASHVGGYLLKTTAPSEPIGLLADLLYTLGWALWTGAIVVVFVQIFPERKSRQIERAIDAYEAAVRERNPPAKGSGS